MLSYKTAALVALGLAGSGCTWGGGGTPLSNNANADKSLAFSTTKPAAEQASWTDPLTKNPVSQAVSSAFKSTADFVTPKPKVVSANDPISLAHKSPPPGADLYVPMAQMHERSGNNDLAAELYNKALAKQPDHLAALLGLAHLYDRQNDLNRAIPLYEQAAKKHPKVAAVHNDLGLCYARQGKFQQSMAQLNRAVQLDPASKLYRNNIATVLIELRRTDEALVHLTHAHGPATAHYNMGYLLQQRGQTDLAAAEFAKSIQMDPSNRNAHAWLAKLNPSAANPAAGPRYHTSMPITQPAVQPAPPQSPQYQRPLYQPASGAPLRTPAVTTPSDGSAAAAPAPSSWPNHLERYQSQQPVVAYPTVQHPQPTGQNRPAATAPLPQSQSPYQATTPSYRY